MRDGNLLCCATASCISFSVDEQRDVQRQIVSTTNKFPCGNLPLLFLSFVKTLQQVTAAQVEFSTQNGLLDQNSNATGSWNSFF